MCRVQFEHLSTLVLAHHVYVHLSFFFTFERWKTIHRPSLGDLRFSRNCLPTDCRSLDVYSVDDTIAWIMDTDKYKRFSWMNTEHGLCKLGSFDIPKAERPKAVGIIRFDCNARKTVHFIWCSRNRKICLRRYYFILSFLLLFASLSCLGNGFQALNKVAHFGIPRIVMDMNVLIDRFGFYSHSRSN